VYISSIKQSLKNKDTTMMQKYIDEIVFTTKMLCFIAAYKCSWNSAKLHNIPWNIAKYVNHVSVLVLNN